MKKQLTLKDYEAHIASMCVAIVSGGIGGGIAKFTMFMNGIFYPHISWYPACGFVLAAFLGFMIAWLVCEHLFPSAHEWYGHGSLSHRIYDLVGIVSGVGIYWLVR